MVIFAKLRLALRGLRERRFILLFITREPCIVS